MKRLLWFIPLALLTLGAAPPRLPAGINALTQAVLVAANTNNAAKLANICTADAVVVDENPPFVWRGANAGVEWWQGVQEVLGTMHATLHVTEFPFSEYRQDASSAYLIQPLKITITTSRKTINELGTETYTFRKVNGAWKISSATWTTKP